MHLDTVFTLLDRDKATAYPKVVTTSGAISLRPGNKPGDFHVTVENDFLEAVADALGVDKLHVVETGGDAVPAGARAVGRRQQRRGPRARRRRRLRAQHLHDRQDARGGRRGRRDRGLRARQGPRRRPLHDVPAPARSGLRRGWHGTLRQSVRWLDRSLSRRSASSRCSATRATTGRRRAVAGPGATSAWSSSPTAPDARDVGRSDERRDRAPTTDQATRRRGRRASLDALDPDDRR